MLMSGKNRKNRKKLTPLVFLLVALVIIFILLFIYFNYMKKNDSTDKTSSTNTSNSESYIRNKTINDTRKKVEDILQDKVANSDEDVSQDLLIEVDKVYKEAIRSSDDNQTKSGLTYDNAITYLNLGLYDEALIIALEAYDYYQEESIAHLIANIYEMNGDELNAILYYEKASSLIKDDDDSRLYSVEYYNNKILELKK